MAECCVEGCTSSISFYRFPKKRVLREKWLKAIGCPEWEPPSTAHVCSKHFTSKQLEDLSDPVNPQGYPDCNLPEKSCNGNVQATNVKVCRFCLATDVRMYSLQTGMLRTCLETIAGLQQNHDLAGLPQYLCYICTAYLLKMYNAIEKSMISQATLLEIYSENHEVTKDLVSEQNRNKLHLVHNLQSHNATPTKVFKYVYDETSNESVSIKVESSKKAHENVCDVEEGEVEKSTKGTSSEKMSDFESQLTDKNLDGLSERLKQEIDESEDLLRDLYYKPPDIHDLHKPTTKKQTKTKESNKKLLVQKQKGNKSHSRISQSVSQKNQSVNNLVKNVPSTIIPEGAALGLGDHNYSFNVVEVTQQEENEQANKKSARISSRKSYLKAVLKNPEDEVNKDSHSYYFDTVTIPLKEQKEEWLRSCEVKANPIESKRCPQCSKWVRRKFYDKHIACHNPSYGYYHCKVCKLRFRKRHFLRKHVQMSHERKHLCKFCPSVFYTIGAATAHRLMHSQKPLHKVAHCWLCATACPSKADLLYHVAVTHNIAPLSGVSIFVCPDCDIGFASQMALDNHKSFCSAKKQPPVKKPAPAPGSSKRKPMKCSVCPQSFDTRAQLLAHAGNVHNAAALKFQENQYTCTGCKVGFTSLEMHRHHYIVCPKRKPSPLLEDLLSKPCKSVLRSVRIARGGDAAAGDTTGDDVPPIEVKYECPICDNVFKTTAQLNQHLKYYHLDQATQFTKFVQFNKSLDKSKGEPMEVESNDRIYKSEKSKDDSETDTCSEGEYYDDQGKDPLKEEDLKDENYLVEALDMDMLDDDI